METAATPAIADEVLTMEEIKKKYDSEWVLIANPQTDQHHQVLSGTVICHHKDRLVFDDEIMNIEPFPKKSAVLYLGKRDGIYLL